MPKNHGTSFSVIFTSTAASAHGLPVMPASGGLGFRWLKKVGWLSRKLSRAGAMRAKRFLTPPAYSRATLEIAASSHGYL